MNPLRNLDELSIENLKAGRITRQAMHEAAFRLTANLSNGFKVGGHGQLSSTKEMELADELNDMLEAARGLKETQLSPRYRTQKAVDIGPAIFVPHYVFPPAAKDAPELP